MQRGFKLSIARRFSTKNSYPFKPVYGAYINGKEYLDQEGVKYQLHSPANKEYLCDVINTSENITKLAIENAHDVFESGIWSKADVRQRAKVLNGIADQLRTELPRLLTYEVNQTGRAIKEMKAQVRIYFTV